MILRILQAKVVNGATMELVARLRRDVLPRLSAADGVDSYVLGYRHTEASDQFLALSTWRDFDAVAAAADGRPESSIGQSAVGAVLQDVTADHFELVLPGGGVAPAIEGPVLGVLTARVRPRSEPNVHAMIESIRPRVEAAGVTALYAGRRLAPSGTSDLAVVAVWSDRRHLQAFAQEREQGALDPQFTAHLLDWRLITYDCFSLDPVEPHQATPAVLDLDPDCLLLGASAGVEAVLGVPGELLLHRRLWDVFELASGTGDGQDPLSFPDRGSWRATWLGLGSDAFPVRLVHRRDPVTGSASIEIRRDAAPG